jgi:hypothetical protein
MIDMLQELRGMAEQSDCATLAGILDLAWREAIARCNAD